jgi:hypothetical protein
MEMVAVTKFTGKVNVEFLVCVVEQSLTGYPVSPAICQLHVSESITMRSPVRPGHESSESVRAAQADVDSKCDAQSVMA